MSIFAAAAISLGSGIASGLMKKKSGDKQAAAARKQAARNAELSWMTTEEELRRVDIDNAKMLSTARSLSAASGFAAGSSQESYIENLGVELQAERDWMEMSGKATAENIRMGGEYTAKGIESDSKTSAVGSILNGVNMFGGSQNWWMS